MQWWEVAADVWMQFPCLPLIKREKWFCSCALGIGEKWHIVWHFPLVQLSPASGSNTTPCCLNGRVPAGCHKHVLYNPRSPAQNLELLLRKRKCNNRMGEKKGEKRCECPVTANRSQVAHTLLFFWKHQGNLRCTSLILTSLGEIVPAPELVSGPVPCRF